MQNKKAYELVTTGKPDDPAFPHAMVLTVSFVISPVIGLLVTVALLAQSLTPASRRQNHTTSPSAFSTVRQRCLTASIASRPASVTIASAPWWDETAPLGKCFASERKQDIFAERAGQVICETARPGRHCERSEAIQLVNHKAGLLRLFAPRNDGCAGQISVTPV